MKNIILIVMLLTVFSCGLGPRKLEGFTVYKESLGNNNRIFPKTNGIYVSKNGIRGFYLYKNGMYHYEYFEKDFWLNPEKEIEKKKFYYRKTSDFGQYRIKNDTIIIQDFASNNNEFYSKWVIEDKYIILNDTTIEKISSYSYLGHQELLKNPIIFRFYPTDKKPDSTKAWFVNKKWYRKKLHESRQ